jgi:hypothetical protein
MYGSSFEAIPVSSIGTRIQEAVESAIGSNITCGTCLAFIQSLNYQDSHDHKQIVDTLLKDFPWPIAWREQHKNRREAISAIIQPIVSASESHAFTC